MVLAPRAQLPQRVVLPTRLWRRHDAATPVIWETSLPGELGEDGGYALAIRMVSVTAGCPYCQRRDHRWRLSIVLPTLPLLTNVGIGCTRNHAAARACPRDGVKLLGRACWQPSNYTRRPNQHCGTVRRSRYATCERAGHIGSLPIRVPLDAWPCDCGRPTRT